MTARSRLLGGVKPPPPPPSSEDTSSAPVDSDFVVILAALLCALICVLGLVTVARCAWLRRITGRTTTTTTTIPSSAAANKGLKKKVLKSLPKLTYGEQTDKHNKLSSDCAICLAEFVAGEEIRVLPQCGHGFHVICIDTWLGSHSSCPSCRQLLLVAPCKKCGGELPLATASTSTSSAAATRDHNHVNRFLP